MAAKFSKLQEVYIALHYAGKHLDISNPIIGKIRRFFIGSPPIRITIRIPRQADREATRALYNVTGISIILEYSKR